MVATKTEEETTETETKTDDVIDIVEEGGVLARMVGSHYRGDERVSSLDLEDGETKLMLFNAGAAKSIPLKEMVGKPFKLQDYLAERVSIKVKDKPPRKGCRLTLWTAGGEMLFTTAESIVLAFDRLISFFGDDVAKIPQHVLIGASETLSGNRWYTVELVDPTPTKKSK